MIPFNIPPYTDNEIEYVGKAIDAHKISGDGEFTNLCSRWLEEKFQAPKVLLTTSGSSALDMAAILCDLKPGDEVILPGYTFSSTANGVVLAGAKPVFADIRPDSLLRIGAVSRKDSRGDPESVCGLRRSGRSQKLRLSDHSRK